jgi:hypothetical protein
MNYRRLNGAGERLNYHPGKLIKWKNSGARAPVGKLTIRTFIEMNIIKLSERRGKKKLRMNIRLKYLNNSAILFSRLRIVFLFYRFRWGGKNENFINIHSLISGSVIAPEQIKTACLYSIIG